MRLSGDILAGEEPLAGARGGSLPAAAAGSLAAEMQNEQDMFRCSHT